MCGLNGVFAYNPSAPAPREAELLATRDHMHARGPDGKGAWWSRNRRCGLGHRRLAVVDLSERALQPMRSAEAAHTIVFNGEIYNAPELRSGLEAEGRRFSTTSDTEVLLQLYAEHGRDMVRRLRGMFAFVIWDEAAAGLFLARDLYGIKPLYVADDGWTLRFASQVKALLAGCGVSRDPEPAGVVGFHLFGSVPEPFTLYRDIRALPAGCTQWIDAGGPQAPVPFASVAAVLAAGASNPAPDTELAPRLRETMRDSVAHHLRADVDVGLFLSGGVDSGALLGLMNDAGRRRVKAVTLAFDAYRGGAEDEAPTAARAAALYGADHVVRRVGDAEFRADLPAIREAMDQPSIDGINSWFVAKAAREAGLKAAVSGVGGDELLGGYPSFRDIPRWVGWMRAPGAVPGIGAGLRVLATALAGGRVRPKVFAMAEYGGDYPGAYLLRRGLFLPFELPALLDRDTVREGLRRLQPLRALRATMTPDPGAAISRVSALESANYLRNQLLRDIDWAAMAHSVEVRTPFVDCTVLQAMAPLLPGLALGEGKRALARSPCIPLPDAVTARAKTGFAVPFGAWTPTARDGASRGARARAWSRQVYATAGVAGALA